MFFAALCGHSSVARAQETFNIDPVTVSPSEVASVKVTVTNPIASSFYTLGIGIANGVSGCQPDPQNPSAAPAGVAGSGPLVLTASPSLDILDTYCVTVLRSPPSPAGVVWTFPQTFSALGSVGTTQSVSPAPGGAGANSNGCLSTATGAYCDIVLLPGVGDSTGKVSLSSCTANGVTTPNGGFGCYVNSLIKLVIGLIGVFSVVMLIVAGVEIMTPGATASEKMTGKARAVNALLGLLVAVGAYVILNTINPNLVNLSITLPSATLIYDNSAFQQSEFSASPTTETSLAPSNLSSSGYMCPGSGGSAVIPGVLGSLQGKVTYRFGGGHSQNQPPYSQDTYMCPAGSGTSCSSFCPAGQLCLDCSSFVDTVLKCAGLSSPGGGTGTLFSSGAGAEKVQGDITYDGSTPVINGIALKDGDLVGWLAGENGDDTGHVLIYSEGMIYDSHGGNNGRIAGKATGGWPFSKYAGEIEHVYRTH